MSTSIPIDLAFRSQDVLPVAVFATATVLYLIYHYAASSARWQVRLAAGRSAEDAQALAVFAQRLSGAVLLGVVPLGVASALGYTPAALGLGTASIARTLACVGIVGGIVVPVVARASSTPAHRALYPEVRASEWSRGRTVANAATWTLYLLGYEALFRGFLLVPLVDSLGTWPAIAANTAIYVAVHLTKDASEASGTVLMGVVFALMALSSGGIWAPFAVHVAVAITSDTIARR